MSIYKLKVVVVLEIDWCNNIIIVGRLDVDLAACLLAARC